MWIASLILSWIVLEAWSKMLKHSSEYRARHCWEFCKCLKMWEVLSQTKCSRTRVDAERLSRHNRHYNLKTTHVRSPRGIGSFKITYFKRLKSQLHLCYHNNARQSGETFFAWQQKKGQCKVIWNKRSAWCLKRKPLSFFSSHLLSPVVYLLLGFFKRGYLSNNHSKGKETGH